MKVWNYLIIICFISTINSLPHFIYDGIESYRQCFDKEDYISFTIYGSLTEEVNQEEVQIEDYLIEEMGKFSCSFSENKKAINKKRKHQITCSIVGSFPRFGYIIQEPKVHGFDFLNENGESTWPKVVEKKTFLIGECGSRLEINDEPLLLSSASQPYSNPISKVRKDVITAVLATLPSRSVINELKMSLTMKNYKDKYALNEAECAYLVYKWIAENIEYDCYGVNHNTANHLESTTYNTGKGVCAGMSYIFRTFARFLGLEAEYISGYTRGATSSNHAWNSVKIDSVYYLVDSTWGAGSCKGDNYEKAFSDAYFCPDPEFFIREHLPVESQWQLVSNIVSYEEFNNRAYLFEGFFSNGLKTISPDLNYITSQGSGKINLTYDESNNNLVVICSLFYNKDGQIIKEDGNTCIVSKYQGNIEVNYLANYNEIYYLYIYAGKYEDETIYAGAYLNINNTKTINNPQYYPNQYWKGCEIKLLEPLSPELTKGTFVDFKIKSSTLDDDQFYILIGEYFGRKFEKQNDGTYLAESVYIHEDEVFITHHSGNSYYYLFKYKTENNPKLPEEPTFPETNIDLPPNVLYSPIDEKLTKGKTYTFKIKCKTASEMIVFDGNNFYDLEKNVDTFSSQLKIANDATQVLIVGYLTNSPDDLIIFYIYKLE